MYIVAGLGNPEKKYFGTRHNAGFEVIDRISNKYSIELKGTEKKAAVGKGLIQGIKTMLVKPLTYMNLSGESVGPLTSYYNLDHTKDVIIIYDDMALDVGQIRVRVSGSAGGHNGIKSIINHFGDNKFIRIRVGVGEKPKEYDQVAFVLGHYEGDDKLNIEKGYDLAVQAVECIIAEGPDAAMNKFNTKKKIEK